MKFLTYRNSPRRRSGHRTVHNRSPGKKLFDCKQGDSQLFGDVTHDADVFVNIPEAVKTHRYRRRLKGFCKEHRFLYHALRRCYEKNHDDCAFIIEILREIYACEGSLMAIFSILLPRHVTKNSFFLNMKMNALYPGCNSGLHREDTVSAFEFYLKHICKSNESFEEPNIPGPSLDNVINEEFDINRSASFTPLSAATSSRDPHFVLLLLRYGADPFYISQKFTEELPQDPVANVIKGLNSIILFKNSFFGEETLSVLSEEEEKGMQCIQFISRAVVFIPLVENMHFQASDADETPGENRKREYNLHPKLSARMDLPSITGPRPLQHLCRIRVRKTLVEGSTCRGTLPSLIDRLPLPTPLKHYIDLLL